MITRIFLQPIMLGVRWITFLCYKQLPLNSIKKLSFREFEKIAQLKVNKSYPLAYLETCLASLLEMIILTVPYRLFYWIMKACAIPLYWILYPYHPIVRTNLSLAFKHHWTKQKIKKVARRSFSVTILNFGEVARFITLTEKTLLEQTTLIGFKNLETSYKRGRGVLLFSAHYGNFLYPMLYLALVKKMKVNFIIRRLDNPFIGFVTYNALTEKNIHPIIRNHGSIKAIFKALDQGEIVYLLVDQNVAVGGIFVPFFGHPASTFRGIYQIQTKTGCDIIGCHDHRDDQEKHSLTFFSEIQEERKNSEYNLILKINQQIERFIQNDPLQHLWLHPRWKRQPQNQKSLYREIKKIAER